MLYNHDLQTIIWTPYKNYSTSIRCYLLDQLRSPWREFIGYEPCTGLEIKQYGVHTTNYPEYYDHFKFILPIRNPYDRVLSQYKFESKYFTTTHYTFKEWFWKYGKDQYRLSATKLYRYNELLKVENIEQELKRLNLHLGYPLPKMNVSQNNNECVLTQEDKDLIYFLHYEDFIAGGYEK